MDVTKQLATSLLAAAAMAACTNDSHLTAPAPAEPAVALAATTPLTYSALDSGGAHACALVADSGHAYCWGLGWYGVLGTGTDTRSNRPVAVQGGLAFSRINAGYLHTCALTSPLPGAAYCWGANQYGQLGTGTTTGPETCPNNSGRLGVVYNSCSTKPVKVLTSLTFVEIQAGLYHTCARTSDGELFCWGFNGHGELGTGTDTDSFTDPAAFPTPVPVASTLKFTAVAAETSFTCAIAADNGAGYCWGYGWDGQLGTGDSGHGSNKPVAVQGGLAFSRISVGRQHTCALTSPLPGAAYCWGSNYYGQLGTGTTTSSNTPVPVTGNLRFTAISVNRAHSCALTLSGAAYCWGGNGIGELGTGTTQSSSKPAAVKGKLTFGAISTGVSHSCALTLGGAAYCWGSNLGNGTNTTSTEPVAVVEP